MGDKNNRLLQILLESQKLILKAVSRNRINRAKRLIHEQHIRIGSKRPGHTHALSLTTRKLFRVSITIDGRVHRHEVQHFINAFIDAGFIPAQQFGHRCDVFRNRSVREQANLLNDITNFASQHTGIYVGDIFSVEIDPTGSGFNQTINQTQGRALATPRGPHKDQDFTFIDIHGEIPHRGCLCSGIGLAHVF